MKETRFKLRIMEKLVSDFKVDLRGVIQQENVFQLFERVFYSLSCCFLMALQRDRLNREEQ